MKTRPLGITIMAVLGLLNLPMYAVLAALAFFNQPALDAVLRTLSPGGSGPEQIHHAMGGFLPYYYLISLVGSGLVTIGFWRLWNWARVVVLGMIGISLIALAVEGVKDVLSSPGALALLLLRIGLCLGFGWYLMSAKVRAAFGRNKGDVAYAH